MADVKQIELGQAAWSDERGWGVKPYDSIGRFADTPVNLHVVSMKPGAVRGNHSHPAATEWLLVCGGPAKIAWRFINDEDVCESEVDGKEPIFFEFPPNVAHAVRNVSKERIYLMAWNNVHDPETVHCEALLGPKNTSSEQRISR